MQTIIRGFANVWRFGGRNARSEFWPYAGAVVALYLIVGWAVALPTFLPLLSESSSASVSGAANPFMLTCILMFGALVALLAAAVARRLHDTGRSAFWGLIPLPFVAFSSVMLLRLTANFDAGRPDFRLFLSAFVSNLLYFAAVVWLIVLLALPSAPGRNRFG